MNALHKKFLIIFISLSLSCEKDKFCNFFPCNQNILTVKDFNKINFRKGMWINNTYYLERTFSTDTTYFINDSIWSLWIYDPIKKTKSGIFNKKYLLLNKTKNSGTIRNYATFNDSATTTYRTYDWYFDTISGYVYVDFNKERRSFSEPIVYSRFIKIE